MFNDLRQQALSDWLRAELNQNFQITPIMGDASFRRYFRIACEQQTFIAADAPPDKENSYSFITLSQGFIAHGINVPKVFSFDLKQGFLLLSDFGDQVYQQLLNHQNATELYSLALEELCKIQACQTIANWKLSNFDREIMSAELLNFRHWFLTQHLKIELDEATNNLLNQVFEQLIDSAVGQPQCCIHRDYHSRNLMVLPKQVGVLDFQDAAWGPITYDAVSLLRDCYITWPEQQVASWLQLFYQKLKNTGSVTVPYETFMRWFDWMGIQRHLKAIFIFARKYHRDGVIDYLPYINNGLKYIINVSQNYSELIPFYRWLSDEVIPGYEALAVIPKLLLVGEK